LLKSGEGDKVRSSYFHFEKQWFLEEDFKEVVYNNLAETFLSHTYKGALDMWQLMMGHLRKFLRGYQANIRGGQRRLKEGLIAEIDKLDKKAEEVDMEVADWKKRNNLEAELVELYKQEELY
jgi:hypothetical protein